MVRTPGFEQVPSIRTRRFAFAPLLVVALIFGVFAGAVAIAPLPARQNAPSSPRQMDPSLYSAMRWRLIGPYRAGRATELAGIPGDPTTYYMGEPGGGVWKTTDGGDVWLPVFDQQHVASVGAVAVAPSNSNIVYAGTGEQTPGDGLYRSMDAGATWTNIGLKDTEYISTVIVDPRNPDIIVVGILGHPILGAAAPNTSKGVFKTTDGGKTWTKTLYKDDMAGVSNMCADPENPRVLYAGLWRPRDFRPGTGARPPAQDSWIYKSTDEGSTWNQVKGAGLPAEQMGRIGLSVAPGDKGRRVFAITGKGLFRSDDGGEAWRKITDDPRIIGGGYICRVYSDPRNPDVVYVMQTTVYRSEDGGKTFAAFKGAPGGDDYHVMWIDPRNSKRMILGSDQGSTISVDAGQTWSSWYNQPTGQFYHVTTDNQFPYVAYAAQQDSGTVAVPDRSDYGEISFRDWFSIGGFEFCYIAPDPLHPNIVYSGGWYGSVVRFDKLTGQIAHVFVRGDKYRVAQMAPLVFSPQDPHKLYLGTQYLLATVDEGQTWQTLSPDLTERPNEPATGGSRAGHMPASFDSSGVFDADSDADAGSDADAQAPRRPAAIETLALSPISAGVIWAGTSDGLIQRTDDGSLTWHNVSPSNFTPEMGVTILEASHFDVDTAYAAVSVARDLTPYIYKTHDAGKTWRKITNGLPAHWVVRVVREDPVRKGLLYAGTENAVYVSFDDGDDWQPLQLNLPATDVRDLAVHGDDLVAATYGRALWVLDDLSPLREASSQEANSDADLLRPQNAIRVRWDNDQETPLPPEVPAGKNPPDGAILDYYLKSAPAGDITLEIQDARGNVVRHFTSAAPPPDRTIKNVPDYWFGPLVLLPKNPGLNRFVWDLRYDDPPALQYSYGGNLLDYVEYTLSDHTIIGDTPRDQTIGPLAVPGQYEVVLSVNGQTYRRPLTVTIDPRVHVSQSDLVAQLNAAKRASAGLAASHDIFQAAADLRAAIAAREKTLASNAAAKDAAAALKDFDAKLRAVQLGNSGPSGRPAPPPAPNSAATPGVGPVNRDLARTLFMIETGDAAPSETAQEAVDESCGALSKNLAQWRELNARTLPSVNSTLQKFNLAPLSVAPSASSAVPVDACAPHEASR